MHELSLATALVDQVQTLCTREHATRVVSIRLRHGALSGVNRESFAFSFPLVAEGTCAEHAQLIFDTVPAELTCDACGQRSQPGVRFLTCAHCGATTVRITGGREFTLVNVEVTADEPSS